MCIVCLNAGDVFHYGTECRIKHLATMMYLVVEKQADGSYEVHINKMSAEGIVFLICTHC